MTRHLLRPTHLFIVSALSAAACGTTHLSSATRMDLAKRYEGQLVELRHSSYFGDLYDDERHYLLSPYPFEDTSHIVDLMGRPIHPQGERGIVPAGTVFEVERIEFPDLATLSKRMLTTPRYNPWVYLRPRDAGVDIPRNRHYVLLLPMDLKSSKRVQVAFKNRLAKPGTVTRWLRGLRPTHRVAVKHKSVKPGMDTKAVLAALGFPHRWLEDTDSDRPAEVAWYNSTEVWLVDGRVTRTQRGRYATRRHDTAASARPRRNR